MPPLEYDWRERQDPAVLWQATGSFDRNGQPIVQSPVEIWVKWCTTRKQGMDAKGNLVEVVGEVVVYQDVVVNSLMYHGHLSTWLGTGSALPEDELVQVIGWDSQTDLKGRFPRRTLRCMRYRDLPARGSG